MEYGIIFWGNSVESKRIFQQQNEWLELWQDLPEGFDVKHYLKNVNIDSDLPIHIFLGEVPLIKPGDLQI
jgi:hypothetical protein